MFEELSQSMPDVISTKWLVLAVLLLLGVKVGAKGLTWIRQASTGMLVASLLFFSGLGGAGYTIGDVAMNWDTPAAETQLEEGTLSNNELLALAEDSPNIDATTLRQILSYAAVRDSQAVVVVNEQGEVVKVHAMPNKLLSQSQDKIQYVTHNGEKKVKVAPASYTEGEEVEETAAVRGPALPLQWSLSLAFGCIALAVIGVVLAGRTANKVRADAQRAA